MLDDHQSQLTNQEIVIKVMYFSFTTLSTVGFGDMRPINSGERLVCAFIMFFGITVFVFVINMF